MYTKRAGQKTNKTEGSDKNWSWTFCCQRLPNGSKIHLPRGPKRPKGGKNIILHALGEKPGELYTLYFLIFINHYSLCILFYLKLSCILFISYYLSLVIATRGCRDSNCKRSHLSGRYGGPTNASPTTPPCDPPIPFLNVSTFRSQSYPALPYPSDRLEYDPRYRLTRNLTSKPQLEPHLKPNLKPCLTNSPET